MGFFDKFFKKPAPPAESTPAKPLSSNVQMDLKIDPSLPGISPERKAAYEAAMAKIPTPKIEGEKAQPSVEERKKAAFVKAFRGLTAEADDSVKAMENRLSKMKRELDPKQRLHIGDAAYVPTTEKVQQLEQELNALISQRSALRNAAYAVEGNLPIPPEARTAVEALQEQVAIQLDKAYSSPNASDRNAVPYLQDRLKHFATLLREVK